MLLRTFVYKCPLPFIQIHNPIAEKQEGNKADEKTSLWSASLHQKLDYSSSS